MICTVCKEEKALSEMNANSRKAHTSESRCKVCQRAYERKYHARHREKTNKYHRDWRARLGDEYRQQCVDRRKRNIAAMSVDELAEFRAKESAKTKRLYEVMKGQVFKAYGGWVCACCGETEKLFLSIDHVFNNGAELKNNGTHGKSSMEFYRWLKNNDYPEGFQILCMNCNIGKHKNGGVCPHQTRCNDYPEREYSQVAGSAKHPSG